MSGDSGGGASGVPAAAQSFHSWILSGYDITGEGTLFDKQPAPGSLLYLLGRAVQETNPYDDVDVVDPTTPMSEVETEIDAFKTMVDNLTSSSSINAQVNSFEQAQEPQLMRSINRITGPMADINAAEGFAFVMAITLLESEFTRSVAAYRASITHQQKMAQIEAKRSEVALRLEYTKAEIVALVDQKEQEAEYAMRAITFEMDLFKYPANAIASLSGGVSGSQTGGYNRIGSSISMAASGAAIGAKIGGAPGAGVGALFGFTAGLIG